MVLLIWLLARGLALKALYKSYHNFGMPNCPLKQQKEKEHLHVLKLYAIIIIGLRWYQDTTTFWRDPPILYMTSNDSLFIEKKKAYWVGLRSSRVPRVLYHVEFF